MKKVLFILLSISFFIACTTSDEGNEEDETRELQWTVTTTNKCSNDSNNIYNTYCVSEATYNTVNNQWISTAPDRNCNEISFYDINGEQVKGIVATMGSNYGACDKLKE